MEDMMGEMLASQQSIKSDLQSSNETMQGMQSAQKEHRANMDMMNRQLAQLANSVGGMKGNSGKLPSTVHVPDKANVSKITLRSGIAYNGPQLKNPVGESGRERVLSDTISAEELKRPLPQMEDPFFLNEKPAVEGKEGETQPGNEQPEGAMPASEPRTQEEPRESPQGLTGEAKGEKPFPYRFVTKRKKENPVDFMSIFGKLDVTIPFLQAVRLPPLGKFIKEFIAGKAQEDGKIMVEGIASAIVQEKLPPKRVDPGMFTLPVTIGDVKIEHAMCDLGASINVMPLSIYNRLKGVKLSNTRVLIQLADRSCINPEGVLENVLVRIQNFTYPADFYVIKMSEPEARESSGILLGRPFLRTAKTIVDMAEGTICIDFNGEKFVFDINEAMKKPIDSENLCYVDVIDPLVQEFLETELLQEKLQALDVYAQADVEAAAWCDLISSRGLTDEEIEEAITEFCQKSELAGSVGAVVPASMEEKSDAEQEQEEDSKKNPLPTDTLPPQVELKKLPVNLKYAC